MSGVSFIGLIGTCLMFELLHCGWILEKFWGFREILVLENFFGGGSRLAYLTLYK